MMRSVTTFGLASSMVSRTTAGAEAMVTAAVAAAQAGVSPTSQRAKIKIRANDKVMSAAVLRNNSGVRRSQLQVQAPPDPIISQTERRIGNRRALGQGLDTDPTNTPMALKTMPATT